MSGLKRPSIAVYAANVSAAGSSQERNGKNNG